MVAKAAVRLRRIRMDKSPESVVFRRSLGFFELGCFCAAMGTEAGVTLLQPI